MATNSIMKDYVRRQLRYWVDELKDGMLPRDFTTKSFTKTQLVLPNIHLKPHRVAAVLHLPSPLLVTTVHCIELTIAVPSWTDADKEAAHKPVLIHINELLVQVHNICECSGELRRVAEERVQAALLEPDPLGSTAAMFEFARDVNDRTKLVVDKLRVQIFIGGVSRVELVLTDFNARTADALWQDPNIELQITFRGTIEAKLKFTSSTEGPQELFLVADRAAGSVIFHRHGARELQMSLHELAVRFRGYVVFRLKPDREVFHLEERLDSLSIKWRVQSVLCRIDDDLATVLTEMYRFVSDKEQAIVIRVPDA
ncbi:hypothetical protein PInf_012263 [Phytophthora infestans]|nr:hypothetical protein PInf_012263 [Phytophthora infestans]